MINNAIHTKHTNANREKTKTMTWVKASKTQLYKLVAEYIELPKKLHTKFTVTPYHTYNLDWVAPKAQLRACYTIIDDIPLLVLQTKKRNNDSYKVREVHELNLEYLKGNKMTKTIQQKVLIKKLLFSQERF